jgi:hypothetical protein
MRCTTAALKALGINEGHANGKYARTGADVLERIIRSGYTPRPVVSSVVTRFERKIIRLSDFVEQHPKGSYYISTHGHAMALIDGRLIDTTERGADGRWVMGAYRLEQR